MNRSERVREIEALVKSLRPMQQISVYWTDITQFREVRGVRNKPDKYMSPAMANGAFYHFDEEHDILVLVNCIIDGEYEDGYGIPIGCIDRIVVHSFEDGVRRKALREGTHPHTAKTVRRVRIKTG